VSLWGAKMISGTVIWIAMGCAGPPDVVAEPPVAEVAQEEPLSAFFERAHAEALATDPVWAAYLGVPHDQTQWTPFGDAREAEDLANAERWLAELATLDLSDLDAQDALSVRLFRREQEQTIAAYPWRRHGLPLTHISGTHTWVASFLMTVHRIDDAASAAAWVERVRNAGPLIDQVLHRVQEQAAQGIRPPAYSHPQILHAIDNLTTGAPFDDGPASPLLAHFDRGLAALALPADAAVELHQGASDALRDVLGPAYGRLAAHVEADAPQAKVQGAWALPDGGAYYAHRLKVVTTTDRTADEIHELGLSEVARIQDEMRALMPALGVKGDLPQLFAHLRNSEAYFESEDEAGRAAYLNLARSYIAGMEAVLPEVFAHLPEATLEVRRVEAWRENSAGKGFYQSPSTDGARPGIFYANLAKMANMPTYQLEALVYHEGVPGHHMQNAVSQRLDDLPPFRRFGHITAYGEGWGLYSEYLPKELGFYSDPASDVGRLAMELWRAARLVVDTGLHDRKWTRDQAIAYLMTETPNPKGDAVKAIERYMVWPGQATAYKIGMIEILRLREGAKEALGERFDLRAFHGVVLGSGPVPLEVLDEQVQAWVADQR